MNLLNAPPYFLELHALRPPDMGTGFGLYPHCVHENIETGTFPNYSVDL